MGERKAKKGWGRGIQKDVREGLKATKSGGSSTDNEGKGKRT